MCVTQGQTRKLRSQLLQIFFTYFHMLYRLLLCDVSACEVCLLNFLWNKKLSVSNVPHIWTYEYFDIKYWWFRWNSCRVFLLVFAYFNVLWRTFSQIPSVWDIFFKFIVALYFKLPLNLLIWDILSILIIITCMMHGTPQHCCTSITRLVQWIKRIQAH